LALSADALVPCFLLYHLDNFVVTLNLLPSPGTGKKHVTATLTAPNQTAGPLAVTDLRHHKLHK
jgi:hypothetical protein